VPVSSSANHRPYRGGTEGSNLSLSSGESGTNSVIGSKRAPAMGKMSRVLEGRGVEGISEMAQEAQQEIGARPRTRCARFQAI